MFLVSHVCKEQDKTICDPQNAECFPKQLQNTLGIKKITILNVDNQDPKIFWKLSCSLNCFRCLVISQNH